MENENKPGKQVWSKSDDLVLIDNYPKFKELSKKQCFGYLAELLPGKDSRSCYDRYKLLDLKHLSEQQAIEKSNMLHAQQAKMQQQSRLTQAFVRMMLSYEGQLPSVKDIQELNDFLTQIKNDLAEYNRAKEDAILFGRHVEMQDLRHNNDKLGMRVVPVTQPEFRILQNKRYVSFMSLFGLKKAVRG